MLVRRSPSGSPGPLRTDLAAELERIARESDIEYVEATRSIATGGDVMSPDGLHPTSQGQQQLALRIEQELERLGLVSPEA